MKPQSPVATCLACIAVLLMSFASTAEANDPGGMPASVFCDVCAAQGCACSFPNCVDCGGSFTTAVPLQPGLFCDLCIAQGCQCFGDSCVNCQRLSPRTVPLPAGVFDFADFLSSFVSTARVGILESGTPFSFQTLMPDDFSTLEGLVGENLVVEDVDGASLYNVRITNADAMFQSATAAPVPSLSSASALGLVLMQKDSVPHAPMGEITYRVLALNRTEDLVILDRVTLDLAASFVGTYLRVEWTNAVPPVVVTNPGPIQSWPPTGQPANVMLPAGCPVEIATLTAQASVNGCLTFSLAGPATALEVIQFDSGLPIPRTLTPLQLNIRDLVISNGIPKAVEVCNGVDDNCDGLVDEGFVYSIVRVEELFSCLAGPDVTPSIACAPTDRDCDQDCDLRDLARWQVPSKVPAPPGYARALTP